MRLNVIGMTVKSCNKIQEIDFPSSKEKRSGWKTVQKQQTWKFSLQSLGNTAGLTVRHTSDCTDGNTLSRYGHYQSHCTIKEHTKSGNTMSKSNNYPKGINFCAFLFNSDLTYIMVQIAPSHL